MLVVFQKACYLENKGAECSQEQKRRSSVVTGSVTTLGVPDQHRLVLRRCQHPFDLGSLLAKRAVHPHRRNQLEQWPRHGSITTDKRTVCHVSVSIGWRPAETLVSAIDASVLYQWHWFVLLRKDTLWFLNKKDTTRHPTFVPRWLGTTPAPRMCLSHDT
jgi:transposase InsO family protein